MQLRADAKVRLKACFTVLMFARSYLVPGVSYVRTLSTFPLYFIFGGRVQDSSDDDMPIAQLAKKHKQAAPAVESDSDDDVLLTDLPKKVMPMIQQYNIER